MRLHWTVLTSPRPQVSHVGLILNRDRKQSMPGACKGLEGCIWHAVCDWFTDWWREHVTLLAEFMAFLRALLSAQPQAVPDSLANGVLSRPGLGHCVCCWTRQWAAKDSYRKISYVYVFKVMLTKLSPGTRKMSTNSLFTLKKKKKRGLSLCSGPQIMVVYSHGSSEGPQKYCSIKGLCLHTHPR